MRQKGALICNHNYVPTLVQCAYAHRHTHTCTIRHMHYLLIIPM